MKFTIEPQEADFFKANIDEILKNYELTKMVVDFDILSGETLAEKYQGVYVKLIELTNVLIRKGTQGYFWLVTSPEIENMLETSAAFEFNNVEQIPMGTDDVILMGILDRKWKVYCYPKMEPHRILVGADYMRVQSEKYGLMRLDNYIK